MPKRMLGVGVCLAVAIVTLAQNKTYTIREGDTLSGIAGKVGSTPADLAKQNDIKNPDALQPGQTLKISSAEPRPEAAPAKSTYTVKKGDNDWTIAKKFKITDKQLRLANPGINWMRLQPGDKLTIPGASGPAATKTASANAPVAKTASAPTTASYVVKKGENDWIIARKLGISSSTLKALNPGQDWTKIQIGQKLVVPSGAAAKVASAPTTIQSRYAVINKPNVSVRRGPGTNSNLITHVPQSTPVTILDRDGSWYKAKFPKGTIGWVRGDFLKPVSADRVIQARVASNQQKPKATAKMAASSTSAKASRLSRTPAKKQPVASNSAGAKGDILSHATSLLGVRYRYGQSSRSGTDCSGFSTQVFKKVGVSLPRTSSDQSKVGAAVSKGNLQKGDLVFFKTNRGTRINHVGIYMGDGKFIHASSGGGKVQINSLNDGYYNRRYAGARRVQAKAAPKAKAEAKPVEKKEEAPKADPEPVKEQEVQKSDSSEGAQG